MNRYRNNNPLLFKVISSSVFVIIIGISAVVGMGYMASTDLPYTTGSPSVEQTSGTHEPAKDTAAPSVTPTVPAETPVPPETSSPTSTPSSTPLPTSTPTPIPTPTHMPTKAPEPTPTVRPKPPVKPPVQTPMQTAAPSQNPLREGLGVSFACLPQGFAVITVNDKAILIDTGAEPASAVGLLAELGIKRLDLFVITTLNSNGIGGAEAVLSQFKPATLIMPEGDPSVLSSATRKIVNKIKALAPNCIVAGADDVGRSFELDGARLTILTPLVLDSPDEYECYSMAIKLDYGGNSFLFMSDITPGNADKLAETSLDIKADVIFTAQNGRPDCISDKLLDKVRPDYAVIAVLNEPYAETAKRLEDRNIDILYIERGYAAYFASDGKAVREESYGGVPIK